MAKKRANGEGNIRKRKDGRWEGRYTAGYDPETGKRIIKNVLGKTQAEVKEKLAQAQQETAGLDVARSEDYTVASWLRSWYELYAKPNVRPATADRYHLIIETYTIPRIGKIKLKRLTSRDLQKLYKDLMEKGRVQNRNGKGNPGLSSTTVRSVHLTLHCAFERAVKERLIPRNPTDDCIAPKVQKVEMKTLLPEHLKSYLDAANARDVLPMFYLELVSGLRKGELVALLWSDLDAEHKTISVSKQYVRNPSGEVMLSRPKTETSVRQVSIPQDAVDLLIQEHDKHPDKQYAGALRCGLHPPHLHPCHSAAAESGGGDDGEFYGAGHVGQKKQQKARQEGGTSCLALSVPLRTFRRVGHGVGQPKTAKINSLKKL